MSLTYTTYVNQLANLMVTLSTDVNFTTFLPGCIDYAEQRIYRELDLTYTRVTDATTSFSSGVRDFTLPSAFGTFIVVEQISAVSPANTTSSQGQQNLLTETSRAFVDATYPSNAGTLGLPQFWAQSQNSNPSNLTGTNMSIIVGPAPDGAYTASVSGTIRPTPLSSGNPNTMLTSELPDLFMAASMVFASGFMRDFSATSDSPQMSQTWEAQYQKLAQSALTEEVRKKYQSQGWTDKAPSPLVTRE